MHSVDANSRYSRQVWIPRFGEICQRKLAGARVAVVGAGGVKSPLLLYLAAAGVGYIRIIDFDRVELSNLNRQILYSTDDIGALKAEVAATKLRAINPEIVMEPVVARIDAENFDEHLGGVDLVIEGGDSSPARKSFNKNALERGMSYIHASAQYNYAYVMTVVPRISGCFECLFSDLPDSHGGPVPILGTAAAVAGSVAASEAITMLCGRPATLNESIFFFDGWRNWATHLPNPRREDCAICVDRTKISME